MQLDSQALLRKILRTCSPHSDAKFMRFPVHFPKPQYIASNTEGIDNDTSFGIFPKKQLILKDQSECNSDQESTC